MHIEEYDTPPPAFADEYAPRHGASKLVAAARLERQRAETGADAPPSVAPSQNIKPLLVGVIGVLAVAGVIALAFSQPAPRPIVTERPFTAPTSAAVALPLAVPTMTPASTPLPTIAPTDPPAEAPAAAPVEPPPQTGQGMTIDQAPAIEQPAVIVEQPAVIEQPPAPAPVVDPPLRIRAEDDCNAEHGRCDPPCTAEHGRCSPGDK